MRTVSRLALRDRAEEVGDLGGLNEGWGRRVCSTVALESMLSWSVPEREDGRPLVGACFAPSSATLSGFSVVMPRSIAAKMRINPRNSVSSRGRLEKRAFSYTVRKSSPRLEGWSMSREVRCQM